MSSERLFAQMKETGLIEEHDQIVVAVSGGPDSMGLLHALIGYKSFFQLKELKLYVAHVNHHTRPGENEKEQKLVEQFCKAHDIPVKVFDFRYNGYDNFHEEARRFRYHAFECFAKEVGANKVALAHHLDDQAETVLFKLIRGSNLLGYGGMKHMTPLNERVMIVRPFLNVTKEVILTYCEKHQVPYLMDSSNESLQYTRNQLRLSVFPELNKIQTDAVEKLEQFRIQLVEAGTYLDQVATKHYKQIKKRAKNEVTLKIKDLKALPQAVLRLVFTKALNELSDEVELTFVKTNALIDFLFNPKPNMTMDLGKGFVAIKAYDELIFKKDEAPHPYKIKIDSCKTYELPNGWKLTVKKVKEKLKINKNRLILCYNNSMWPLYVRSPLPGDRIKTKIGHKKINRIFINKKIPQHERPSWPIVTDGENRILWVVGLEKTDNLFLNDSEQYIVIEMNEVN